MIKYINILLVLLATMGTCQASPESPFRIFDATAYRNKPDLASYGIESIEILYVSQLYPEWPSVTLDRLPDISVMRKETRRLAVRNRPVVVDIEHWPLRGEPKTVASTIYKYNSVLTSLRKMAPSLKFGLYGVLPTTEYHRALENVDSTRYQSWHDENERLRPISENVDFTFPSAYTFNLYQQDWEKYAIAQVNEARIYNKPVYLFLWPQFHDSNPLLSQRYLSYEYWMLQLKTAAKHADGVVIWGGHSDTGRAAWNESADWWLATKDFIGQIQHRHLEVEASR